MVNRYLLPATRHPARSLGSLAGSAIPNRAVTGVIMHDLAGRLISQYWISFGLCHRNFTGALHVNYLQFFLSEVNIIYQSVFNLRVQTKLLIQILDVLVHSLSNLGPGLFPFE